VPIISILGTWSGTIPFYGPHDLIITDQSWTLSRSDGSSTNPVVFVNIPEQYVILLDGESGETMRVEWTIVSDNQITLTFYNANPTIQEAINETESI